MLDRIDSAMDRRIGKAVSRLRTSGQDRHAVVRNLFIVGAAALVCAGFAPNALPPLMTCVEYAMVFVSLYVAWTFDRRVGDGDDPMRREAAEKERQFLHENLGAVRKGCLLVSVGMAATVLLAVPAVLHGGAVPVAHFALLAVFCAMMTTAFYALGAPAPERRTASVRERRPGRTD